MGKGCCLGCLIAVLLVAACVAGVAFLAVKFDITHEAAPVDTVAHIGGQPEFLARINPNAPELMALLVEGFSGAPPPVIAWFLPHEISVAIGYDREKEAAACAVAVSLRRLAGALAWLASDAEGWRFSPVQRALRVAKERDGLWVIRSQWATSEETRDRVARWWKADRFVLIELEGGHLFEAVLDNRAGGGLLALEALLAPEDFMPEQREVVVKAPFDVEAQRLPGLFRRLETLRVSMDLEDGDRMRVRVDANCRDAAAAESLAFFLYTLRDLAYRDLIESDVILDSDIVVSGAAIRGVFTLEGVREIIVRAIRDGVE
ncbi:MAG TPA: hypothetical protein PKI11_04510 [Candidatus Hydrogenedentes bacterium]|nr:hypothetical protein [Candidatus Hydrogenedentota bacterium]